MDVGVGATAVATLTYPSTINEGSSLAGSGAITAAGAIAAAEIRYGDSPTYSPLTLDALNRFNFSHFYSDSGALTIQVRARLVGADSFIAAGSFPLTVVNVSPTADLVAPIDGYQGVTGQEREFQLNLSDISFNDFTAGISYTVDWGDGSTETSSASGEISLTHTYYTTGDFAARVTATDKDGGVSLVDTVNLRIRTTETQGPALAVGGTAAEDMFQVTVGPALGAAAISRNGAAIASVVAPQSLRVYGGSGSDVVRGLAVATGDTFEIRIDDLRWHGVKVTGNNIDAWIAAGQAGNDVFKDYGGRATVSGFKGADRLYAGADIDSEFRLTGVNYGTLNERINFDTIPYLHGQNGNDKFVFTNSGSLTERIDGGNGVNTLDYSAVNSPVAINAQLGTAPKTRAFTKVQRFLAGTNTNDRLISPDTNNTWVLTGIKQGDINETIHFEGFEFISGGRGNDRFKLAMLALPSLFTTIDGLGGVDALDYSLLSTPVEVDLEKRIASSVPSYLGIEQFTGSSTLDTLIGLNKQPQIWSLTGLNAGSVNIYSFSGFENLRGGTLNDVLQPRPGASLTGGFDGRTGSNTVDFSLYGEAVNVDLRRNTAPGIPALTGVANLIGSPYDDILIGDGQANNIQGGAGHDIISGEAGNDLLNGNAGRDLIFGGAGVDSLDGSVGDDILVGGSVTYTSNPLTALESTALANLREVWTSLKMDFAERADTLASGVGFDLAKLATGTVIDDRVVDTLIAGTLVDEFDWMIGGRKDTVKNNRPTHRVTRLS